MPTVLSFDYMYLGYGTGLEVLTSVLFDHLNSSNTKSSLLGHLIIPGSVPVHHDLPQIEVYALMSLTTLDVDNPRRFYSIEEVYGPYDTSQPNGNNCWVVMPGKEDPFILPGILHAINDKSSVVTDAIKTPGVRRFVRTSRKFRQKTSPPPLAYYTVKLTESAVRQQIKSIWDSSVSSDIQYNHRWDVRGHERLLPVKRGLLPTGTLGSLLEATFDKLRSRGYRVYTTDNLSRRDARCLANRGIRAKQSDEWVAIKTVCVKPHVKGPEDKPYVPSIHQLS